MSEDQIVSVFPNVDMWTIFHAPSIRARLLCVRMYLHPFTQLVVDQPKLPR